MSDKVCHLEGKIGGIVHVCNRAKEHEPPHLMDLFKSETPREPEWVPRPSMMDLVASERQGWAGQTAVPVSVVEMRVEPAALRAESGEGAGVLKSSLGRVEEAARVREVIGAWLGPYYDGDGIVRVPQHEFACIVDRIAEALTSGPAVASATPTPTTPPRSCLWHADCDAADRALRPGVMPSHPPLRASPEAKPPAPPWSPSEPPALTPEDSRRLTEEGKECRRQLRANLGAGAKPPATPVPTVAVCLRCARAFTDHPRAKDDRCPGFVDDPAATCLFCGKRYDEHPREACFHGFQAPAAYYCENRRCTWRAYWKPRERRCPACGATVWKDGTANHKPRPALAAPAPADPAPREPMPNAAFNLAHGLTADGRRAAPPADEET